MADDDLKTVTQQQRDRQRLRETIVFKLLTGWEDDEQPDIWVGPANQRQLDPKKFARWVANILVPE